jgi:hypothetical protein
MPKKPTAADAQLILQLYDFRREAEMRKARSWWAGSFWPQSVDDISKVSNAFGSNENTWFRQVSGYWEMAAALVLRGTLNEDVFFDTNNEMWFILAKVHPLLKEYREKSGTTQFLQHTEKLARKTSHGRERLDRLVKQVEGWRKAFAAKAGS